jgi:dTDP-4-dehydrorhamnose reductase
MKIISSGNWKAGIYNFTNDGFITWFDFANTIKELIGSSCKINPITTAEFPTPAKRPAWSVLDNSKIQQTYGIKLKHWRESLQRCIDKLS